MRLIVCLTILLISSSEVYSREFKYHGLPHSEISIDPGIRFNREIVKTRVGETRIIEVQDIPRFGDQNVNDEVSHSLVYKSDGVDSVIYSDKWDSSMSGEYLTKVIIPNMGQVLPYIIYEVNSHSVGASGLYTGNKEIYVAFLDKGGAKKVYINGFSESGEDWNLGSMSYEVTHNLRYENLDKPFVIFRSALNTKIYELSTSLKQVNDVTDSYSIENSPSFECEKSNNIIEYTICKDPALASLDVVMSRIYGKYRAKEKTKQRRWVKSRSVCSKYPLAAINICLASSYEKRIAEIIESNGG